MNLAQVGAHGIKRSQCEHCAVDTIVYHYRYHDHVCNEELILCLLCNQILTCAAHCIGIYRRIRDHEIKIPWYNLFTRR